MPGHWKRNMKVVAPRRCDVLAHLAGAALGASDDEAPALGELVEGLAERVGLREHVALPPLHVGLVLVLEVWPRGAQRGGVITADVQLLDDRNLARGRQAAALALGVIEADLALELGELRMGVEQPGVGQARSAQDGAVAVGGEPDRRSRELRRP